MERNRATKQAGQESRLATSKTLEVEPEAIGKGISVEWVKYIHESESRR